MLDAIPRLPAIASSPTVSSHAEPRERLCREALRARARSTSLVSTQDGVLDAIAMGDVNVACWLRDLPAAVAVACAAVARTAWEGVDVTERASRMPIDDALSRFEEPVRTWLARDVRRLVATVARAGDARALRMTFGAASTDKCRKFHCDMVRYRLVTTYAGPGTEWLANEDVDRDALERLIPCAETSNRLVVRDPLAVNRAHAGDVLLMKGARDARTGGAVHRSPPIEHLGARRLVLVVSTVD